MSLNLYGQVLGSATLFPKQSASFIAWPWDYASAAWIQAHPLGGLGVEKVFEVRNVAFEIGVDQVRRLFFDVVNVGNNWGSCGIVAYWTDAA